MQLANCLTIYPKRLKKIYLSIIANLESIQEQYEGDYYLKR